MYAAEGQGIGFVAGALDSVAMFMQRRKVSEENINAERG